MKRNLSTLLTCLWMTCLAAFTPLIAQQQVNLAGEWKGTATEATFGAKSYVFNIKVEQNGAKLKGTSFTCEKARPQFYAIMKFEAGLTGNNRVAYRETAITEYKIEPGWEWCLQYGYLVLDTTGNEWTLTGTLGGTTPSGDPCVSAKIVLKKPAPPKPPKKPVNPPVAQNNPVKPPVKPPVQNPPAQNPPVKPPVQNPPVQNPPVQNPPVKVVPETPAERAVDKQSTVAVSSNVAKLYVWDADALDGDSISVSLNGKSILDNYKLTGAKKEIEIKLQPGTNMVVLHAINLGRIPPNTAAISVYDGKNWHSLKLKSDMQNSGALEIVVGP